MLGARSEIPVSGSIGERIATIAEAQRGRVSRRQLLAAAIGSSAIERRVQSGYLIARHRGVYAVGHVSQTPLGRETAALLAVRDGAVLSHHSACALWGLRPAEGDGVVHLLVQGGSAGTRHGVRIHRTRRLDPEDVRIQKRLPVTSPARALLDIAGSVSERQLELAFDQGLVQRVLQARDVDELLRRIPGHPGAPLLSALLERQSDPALTRSQAEERLLALIRAAQLPHPRVNTRVHGYEVDFHWPRHRFVAEVDGFQYHCTRRAFEHDRRKDATLRAAGLATMRVTWRQIEDQPYAVIALLAQALTPAHEAARA